MAIKELLTEPKPAQLILFGHPPLDCLISQIGPEGISLQSDKPLTLSLSAGDLAEVKVSHSDTISIRTSVIGQQGNLLRLKYINPDDHAVKRLVNWFSQPPKTATVGSIINEQSVINSLRSTAQMQLERLINEYLNQSGDRLIQLAEKAANNDQQNQLFETLATLKQDQPQIVDQFLKHIDNAFNTQNNSSSQSSLSTPESTDDLELVDLEEFEDWLSLDIIVRRAQERYALPLACLQQRFSKLFIRNFTEESLPVGVYQLCEALQSALKPCEVPRSLLPALYRLFDEYVIRHLEDFYDVLNQQLKNSGVLPKAENQVLSGQNRPKNSNVQGSAEHTPNIATTGFPEEAQEALHPGLYQTVTDLLQLVHSAAPAQTTTIDPESTISDPQELLQQLNVLQGSINTQNETAPLLNQITEQLNTALSQELNDLVSLVSNVFTNLNTNDQISDTLAQQLNRLQVPLVKQALSDASFFSSAQHPAKQLLNLLVDLTLNSEQPNQSLERKLDSIIGHITDSDTIDVSEYESALSEASAVAEHQYKAYQRNTERVAQTYEGQQRVQRAEDAVQREISRRVAPPDVPEVVLELLENGWQELLKITYIRQGADSPAWQQQLATLDQLLNWISELEEDLSTANLEREVEADTFADLLAQEYSSNFPSDFRLQDTVEKIREVLKGELSISYVPVPERFIADIAPPSELHRELEAAHPELSRWFKRAKSLKVGEELGYLGSDNGERNIKLAWVSDSQQHFVFVNNRGQKVYDYDLVDLAKELAGGLSPVDESTDWPIVERSLYSTVQQAYEELAYKSSHDELTGLASRKECERFLNGAITEAKNKGIQHTLLYADIDNFSLTNDLHGHIAGDKILIDLSNLLLNQSIDEAFIGRMAGNEFIIFLPGKPIKDAQAVADMIRGKISAQHFVWEDHDINLTTSIGLITIDKFTSNTVDLLRNAVSACQSAKKRGGDRVMEFQHQQQTHSRREKLLAWIDKLNTILESDKLVLRGQAITPLHDDHGEPHYEILLAIKSDQGGLESPVEFIEAAECYHRMQRVDRWVIEHAFEWLSQQNQKGLAPSISVNLSGNSLNDDTLMDFVLEMLAKYKVPTKNVCFEVTETATIDNLAQAADFIREVKKIGCKFSLDDFGSGNASYQYLKHLPVDYIKIDGMFVKEMDKNDNDLALVKSINEIAHLMGKETIAECAESLAIVDMLRDIGVDYVQGYAINKPTPLTEIQL